MTALHLQILSYVLFIRCFVLRGLCNKYFVILPLLIQVSMEICIDIKFSIILFAYTSFNSRICYIPLKGWNTDPALLICILSS
jgi:hypothetical protein